MWRKGDGFTYKKQKPMGQIRPEPVFVVGASQKFCHNSVFLPFCRLNYHSTKFTQELKVTSVFRFWAYSV